MFRLLCYGKEEKPQSPLFAMVSATTVSRIRQCRRLFRNRPPANPARSLGGSFLRSAGKGGCSNAVIAIFPASVGGGRGAAKTAAATLEQKSFLPPPLFLLPMCICKSQSRKGSAHKSKFFPLLSVRSFCPAAAAATQNIRIWRRRSFPKRRGRSPMPFLSFSFFPLPSSRKPLPAKTFFPPPPLSLSLLNHHSSAKRNEGEGESSPSPFPPPPPSSSALFDFHHDFSSSSSAPHTCKASEAAKRNGLETHLFLPSSSFAREA